MWTPDEATQRIADRSLLADSMFSNLDADAILDLRDGPFDDDWCQAAETVELQWEKSPESTRDDAAMDAVREAAFRRVFDASGGNHELAATVSDDFEVICKRALLQMNSTFITQLEKAYDAHQIPH